MKEINIAKTLLAKRKGKAITQDELAAYIGVSKASVSKWETGQSYPDITFLPQLAAYFNISIDELIGYEPQMTREDIKKLYHQLTGDFSGKPYGEVIDECRAVIRKYYSCFPLLLQMSVLLINHYMLAGDKAAQEAVLQEILDLCRRIKTEDDDVRRINEAVSLEAVVLMLLQRPDEVLDLLDGSMKPAVTHETVLAGAYQMTGRVEKAKDVLQIGLYQHLIGLIDIASGYLALCQDTPERFETVWQRIRSTAEIFNMDQLHPGIMMPLYLNAAQGYVLQNKRNRALDMIGRYADVCCAAGTFPIIMHGDDFFDRLEQWFADFDLGGQAPRDEKIIKKSMLQAITDNPVLAALAETPEYQSAVARLKANTGG